MVSNRWQQRIRMMGGVTGILGGVAVANDIGLWNALSWFIRGQWTYALTQIKLDPGTMLRSIVANWILPQAVKAVGRGFGVRMPWWL